MRSGFSNGFDLGYGSGVTTRLGLHGGARAALLPFNLNVAVALAGTATGNITETDIVNGGKTIVLTLTNDTWVAAGATFNAERQNIIDGISDTDIAGGLVVGDVVRTSDTVVTITMSAIPTYDITADSTVTVTVPDTALTNFSTSVAATPTFTVSAVVVTTQTGGGSGAKGKRRRKYPRRVSIDGQLYTVQSAEEERELLRQWRETLEARAQALEEKDAPRAEVAKAKVKVIRAQRRIERVDDREDDWLAQLREEDEEILMVLLH